jgi:hypothetical protein
MIKSLVQTSVIAALWISLLALLSFTKMDGYGFFLLIATPVFLLVFIAVRLLQRRFIDAAVLLIFPFLLAAALALLGALPEHLGIQVP